MNTEQLQKKYDSIMEKQEHISNRRNTIINMNRLYNYSTTLVPKEKSKQYYDILLNIRATQAELFKQKREVFIKLKEVWKN